MLGKQHLPLAFFDPALMADWIDKTNSVLTHWQLPGLQYKDRGVTIEYRVPAPLQKEELQWWNRSLRGTITPNGFE